MFRKKLSEINDFTVMPGNPRVKMDQNESPHGIPAVVSKKITERFSAMDVNRYMRPVIADELRGAISEYCMVPSRNIAVGAGADSMIHTLIEIFAGEGGTVFHFEPSYPIYGLFADICGCKKLVSDLNKADFSINKGEVEAMVSNSDIAFFTYPNNPTGGIFEREYFLDLVDNHRKCHFVADEAYYEFSGRTFADAVLKRENLTVIRTFSKYFSIPSLRLGYAITSKRISVMIRKCQFEPYNLSTFSAAAGIEIMKNRDLFVKTGDETITERDRLFKELSKMNDVEVYPSHGNFLFIRERRGLGLAGALYNHGIFVRDYGQMKGYNGYFRVTVGKPEENNMFMNTMMKILKTRSD